MTLTPPPCRTDRDADRFALPAGFRRPFAALVIAVTTLIVVGHGCHGDDVDHEPAVAPVEPRPDPE